jgi:hypothetical protein
MDEIDKVLWIVDPTKPSYAMSHHHISLGNSLTHLEVIVVLPYFYVCLNCYLCLKSAGDELMIATFCCMLMHAKPNSLPE